MNQYNQRYARHYVLKDFGAETQSKLNVAKVLVIGAGGLGCPVLQYLAAAGVGTIGIVDHDVVSLSNLQRQVLYDTSDIGRPKSEIAAMKLQRLNPEIEIEPYKTAINTENAWDLISGYDIVVDCTDNFTSRYLINDACVLMDKPLVFGAVFQYEGQVAVFNSADQDCKAVNYRDLFESPPGPHEVADCNESGVLGVLPGIIGMLQATEVIKLITGIGEILRNKLLTFNLLNYDTIVLTLSKNSTRSTTIPTNREQFSNMDYDWFCGTKLNGIANLSATEFLNYLMQPDTIVIDVRNADEMPKAEFDHINIPLAELDETIELSETNILLFCQSGKRSLQAAEKLLTYFGKTKTIGHLQGGIIELYETKIPD